MKVCSGIFLPDGLRVNLLGYTTGSLSIIGIAERRARRLLEHNFPKQLD